VVNRCDVKELEYELEHLVRVRFDVGRLAPYGNLRDALLDEIEQAREERDDLFGELG
jgi:hypothetical protein